MHKTVAELRRLIKEASAPAHCYLNPYTHGVTNGIIVAHNVMVTTEKVPVTSTPNLQGETFPLETSCVELGLIPEPEQYTSQLAADAKNLGRASIELLLEVFKDSNTAPHLLAKIKNLLEVYAINLETAQLRTITEPQPLIFIKQSGATTLIYEKKDILTMPEVVEAGSRENFLKFYIADTVADNIKTPTKSLYALYLDLTKTYLGRFDDPTNQIPGI